MKEHTFFEAVVASASAAAGVDTSAVCLQALFESSPVATVALDAQHQFVMCNSAFETLFQFSADELLGSDFDELISVPATLGEARTLSRMVLQGEKVHMMAKRRRKDGVMLDVEIHGIPLIVEGTLSGVYGVYQDVTERNRAQTTSRHLSNLLEDLQQKERRRIARELHDSTSQELAVLNWNLTQLSNQVSYDPDLHDLVMQTKKIAQQCSTQIRSATYLLHPPELAHGGLSPAVMQLGRDFERRSGIRVTVDAPYNLGRFADPLEAAMLRVMQESLANVLRHSGSPAVHVSLQQRLPWLTLTVSDIGKQAGAKAPKSTASAGLGISGMRERLRELGGQFAIERTSHGTTVVAKVPIERRADA